MVKPKKFQRRLPNGNLPGAAKPRGVAKKGKPGVGGSKGQHQTGKAAGPPARTRPAQALDPFERILLVGEGDFSFAASLVEHHGCADVVATSFDSEDQVTQKYPSAPAGLATLAEAEQTVLYSIDATRIDKIKSVRTRGPFDRIIFNFPHIGGKTKDVDRQIRGNQELLLSFFRASKDLLSTITPNSTSTSNEARRDDTFERTLPGAVFVTIFDQAPYTTDWNIKSLARDAGLVLVRSEVFDFGVYPGYGHVRTLGTLGGGVGQPHADGADGDDNEDSDGEEEEDTATTPPSMSSRNDGGGNSTGSGPGWKGHDRKARTFIFEAVVKPKRSKTKRQLPRERPKRKGGFEDVSSDDD